MAFLDEAQDGYRLSLTSWNEARDKHVLMFRLGCSSLVFIRAMCGPGESMLNTQLSEGIHNQRSPGLKETCEMKAQTHLYHTKRIIVHV